MTSCDYSVLLVGREFLESSVASDWFLKRRRKCLTVSTLGEIHEIIGSRKFDLILSNYQLPDGTGFALIDRFRDCPVSLFVSHQVENGSIWLPGILRGIRCWGAAALKPQAFARLLADLISETREFVAQTTSNTMSVERDNFASQLVSRSRKY
jgi:CheY-like chemotaxis protein